MKSLTNNQIKKRKDAVMMLRFSDGMTINTDGEYRSTRKSDGLYVVGHGVSIPVEDREEARVLIEDLERTRSRRH